MKTIYETTLPGGIFATYRKIINSYQELFNLCPNIIAPEMGKLGCECMEPSYCFTIDYNKNNGEQIDIEYFEAVKNAKTNSEIIKFKELPKVKALCIKHYGAYETFAESINKLFEYIQTNGYTIADHPRFCYIDGIWNKENIEEWLTEIQIPIE